MKIKNSIVGIIITILSTLQLNMIASLFNDSITHKTEKAKETDGTGSNAMDGDKAPKFSV